MSVKTWQRAGLVALWLWAMCLVGEWIARRSNPAALDLEAVAAYSRNGHRDLEPDEPEEVSA